MAKKKDSAQAQEDPIEFTPAPELVDAAAEPAEPAKEEVPVGSGSAEGPNTGGGPLTGSLPAREQASRSPKHGDVPLGSGAAHPPIFAGPLGAAESMAEKAAGKSAKQKSTGKKR
jgi:hypothetical protein